MKAPPKKKRRPANTLKNGPKRPPRGTSLKGGRPAARARGTKTS